MKYSIKDREKYNPYESIQTDIINAAVILYDQKQYDLAHHLYLTSTELSKQLLDDLVSDQYIDVSKGYEQVYEKLATNKLSDKSKKQLLEFAKDWTNFRQDSTKEYSFHAVNLSDKKDLKINYTVPEKIKHYKKRVNDKSLRPGQRIYAKKFLESNGVSL